MLRKDTLVTNIPGLKEEREESDEYKGNSCVLSIHFFRVLHCDMIYGNLLLRVIKSEIFANSKAPLHFISIYRRKLPNTDNCAEV